jgi:RimJ/RimL family protein N-acetyltransferase
MSDHDPVAEPPAGFPDGGPTAPITVPDLADAAVRLRPPVEADIPALIEAVADPEIPRWTLVPQPYGPAEARAFIRIGAEGPVAGTDIVFAWERVAEPGRLAGAVGLHDIEAGGGEIGYWTAPWGRGQGLTTRAIRLVCGWALDPAGLGLDVVQWRAHDGNVASRRIAERLGFRITGLRRLSTVQRGVRHDEWCGDLVRGELV